MALSLWWAGRGDNAVTVEVPPRAPERIGTPAAVDEVVGHWEELGLAPWVEPAFRRVKPFLPTAAFVLAVYGVARLITFVGDLFAAHLNYAGDLTGPIKSWDSSYYLQLAQSFYPAHQPVAHGQLTYSAAGFEPFFPALIRLFMLPGLSPLQAAEVVSVLGGAVATLLVWRLGAALGGEEVGRITAVLFVLFPGMAVVWGLIYSECVGLALVAGSLLLMVHRRWVWAGIVGALATATSPMALPLVLPGLVEGIYGLRHRRGLAPFASSILVPTGFLAYVGYLAIRYHDVLFWWHLQRQAWGARVDFGKSFFVLLWHPLNGGFQGKGWMEWIGLVVVVLAIGFMYKAKLRSPAPVYCLGVFLLCLFSNELGFKPRFLTWAFPALIGLAIATRRRGWQPVAMLFGGLLPLVLLLYTMNGNYIVQP
jgi:hypothetical protein